MRLLVKRILYRLRITEAMHRIRNRNTLTCVMLHRVLPDVEIEHFVADPEWTLRSDTFEKLLVFLSQHYNLVDFDRIRRWADYDEPLPHRALLVTFDDGWRDTFVHAGPILKRLGLPAHVFVASDKVGSYKAFWQEQIDVATHGSTDRVRRLVAAVKSRGGQVSNVTEVKAWLAKHEPVEAEFAEVLELLKDGLPFERQMMTANDLKTCREASISIGAHGASHAPLTSLEPAILEAELERSRRDLEDVVGTIDNLSFPHGATSTAVLSACLRHGFRLLFDSKPAICNVRKKFSLRTIPRVHLSEQALSDNSGFSPSEAAHSLFFRPHV